MWDSKLATLRHKVGYALVSRREARWAGAQSLWARRAIRALDRAERQAHRRFLSAATRDTSVLADVYGEGEGEENPLPCWGDTTPSTTEWWETIEKDEEYYDSSSIDRYEYMAEFIFALRVSA